MHDRTAIDAIEKLRESEEQFRLIAESLPGICWISDGAGDLLWANREWHALFDGTSAEDGDPRGICHPDDLPILGDLWRRMRAIGEVEAVQLRLRGRDGIYRPFLSKAAPVRNAAGEVVRWCGVQIDLSDRHAHDRRQTVLRAFHEQSRDLADPHAILAALSRILFEHLGIRHLLYGETEGGDARTLDVFHAADGVPQCDPASRFCLNAAFASLTERYDWSQSRVVEDNRTLGRGADDPVQRAADLMGVCSSINVPIVQEGRPVAMIAVLDTAPRRWSRDDIELCEELSDRTWSAIARARAETALQERERSQAFLIAWSDALRGETDAQAIMATTLERLARHLGITRATYSEADASGRIFAILGEWRAEQVISIDGTSFSLEDVGETVEREWVSGAVVRYDDVGSDPRIETERVAAYTSAQIHAFVSVPLIENGRVRSALSVQHEAPRVWTEAEIQLLRDVAERTWVTLERARAQAELLERERHQAFLIDWSDKVRGETSTRAIIAITLEWLGRHLGTTRTTYAECDASGRQFTVTGEWREDRVVSIHSDSFSLQSVGAAVDREWTAGEVIRYDDVAGDPRLEAAAVERYLGRQIGAFVSIPLVQGGQMRSALSVQHIDARRWSEGEIQLMRDIAERTWVALERARVQQSLEERERNQRLLLDWNDRVRGETSARGILAQTLVTLGEHFGALRANFAERLPDGDLCVLQDWTRGVESLVGQRFSPAMLGEALAAHQLSGQTVRVDHIADHPLFDDTNRPLFEALGIASVLTISMMRAGRMVAMLSIQLAERHRWTDNEVELVHDLADRTLSVLERAHSEERLAENEAQLHAFLENAPVAMHLKDADGRYIRVNPEFARSIGMTPEEMLGAHPDELFPTRIAAEIAELEAQGQAGKVASAEMAIGEINPDGHVLQMVFPIGSGAARTGGFTIDLSERKRAEAALAKSRETLYQTEKLSALGSLLAGVSHELNNPLSIVVAQAVMMERQSRGSELAERAQKIRKAADRCARIVQTFLAMARQKRPERESVDLNAVAMAAYDLAEYGLRNDGIAATRDLAPALPPISADSDQLHQIIINLIVNAQQALVEQGAPDRALTLRTAVGETAGTVVLEVSDNGPGIPDEARRRVFEPFYTTKPQGQGTGVGLSFSQGLAEAHGGRLELVPTSRGACFRLTLPVDLQPVAEVMPAEPEAEPETPARRALVVDDEQEIAESLADFLSIEGFTCDIAVGGAEAKVWLAQGRYDLIVSDLRMPGIDGPALHAWIAEHRPDLIGRVGFATGDTLGQAAARFLETVDCPVLEKPFMPDSVQHFLQQMDLA